MFSIILLQRAKSPPDLTPIWNNPCFCMHPLTRVDRLLVLLLLSARRVLPFLSIW